MLPGHQVRGRVDGAVVAQIQQADRVDLEVEVIRRRRRIARVAHEPEYGARLDLLAVDGKGRVGGQVRVIKLVARLVPEPEPVSADVVPPDREDGSVRDREQRLSDLAEDVVAVMPA